MALKGWRSNLPRTFTKLRKQTSWVYTINCNFITLYLSSRLFPGLKDANCWDGRWLQERREEQRLAVNIHKNCTLNLQWITPPVEERIIVTCVAAGYFGLIKPLDINFHVRSFLWCSFKLLTTGKKHIICILKNTVHVATWGIIKYCNFHSYIFGICWYCQRMDFLQN